MNVAFYMHLIRQFHSAHVKCLKIQIEVISVLVSQKQIESYNNYYITIQWKDERTKTLTIID